jgi:hypothetical protein
VHVAVLNSEPALRVPSRHTGYDTFYIRSVQRHFRDVLQRMPRQRSSADVTDDSVRWFGLGHSVGCFTLSHLDFAALNISKLVFWGASPLFVHELADLSRAGEDGKSPLSLLVLQGSDDKLLAMATASSSDPQQQQQQHPDFAAEFAAKLPRATATTTRVLPGGTHRGFASYESRALPEPQSDQSRDQQQREAVRLTVQFLLNGGEEVSKYTVQ